ncbi:MAG: MarR family transcriptional regulator [bacterium]|nr:MarR family transcriptional regulator [bacterium]
MHTRQIRSYRRILRRFERVTNAQLKSCCSHVTLAQCLVLLEIEEGGRLTMGQLAANLRLDNSTLSRTVDGLVAKGLLGRERGDSDRRVVWIELTPEGAAVSRSIHEENDTHSRRVFDKIPASRRDAVIRDFEILVQAYLDCEAEEGGLP